LHDEEEAPVEGGALGFGLEGVEARGEAYEAGEDEEREADAVEAEVKADTEEFLEAGIVLANKLVIGPGSGRVEAGPEHEGEKGGEEEAEPGDGFASGEGRGNQEEERGG